MTAVFNVPLRKRGGWWVVERTLIRNQHRELIQRRKIPTLLPETEPATLRSKSPALSPGVELSAPESGALTRGRTLRSRVRRSHQGSNSPLQSPALSPEVELSAPESGALTRCTILTRCRPKKEHPEDNHSACRGVAG